MVEQIGAGGMGVVYRARDERLARDVALKVLPAGALADEVSRKRFCKEALALAKLNHPNIGVLYDFDSQGGIDFLAMECVAGPTLDQKLIGGALPEKEVVRLGAQIAAALEEAHEHEIVHRDLKPSNIAITRKGQAKVLDFGLAKLLHPPAETVTAETLSETRAAGTLPYMAPEQLRGEPADHRSDIFSAGAVLYEMATGQRPFRDNLQPRLIDAILNQPVRPPSSLNRRVSPALEAIILKALDKDPERRYQSAKELRIDLERLAAPSSVAVVAPGPARLRRWPLALAGGFATVLLMVLAFNVGGWRERLRGSPAPGRVDSLAVLPLENFSHNPEQDYFADGMTEELITQLAQIGAVRVISRTSVMPYKGVRTKPLPQIARELNVDAVVEGSVQRSGDRVRVTAQLVEGATDRHLWAQSYERDLKEVLALQSEVARAIAGEIRITLTPQQEARLVAGRTVNPVAHDAYLRGRSQANEHTRESLQKSIEYYQKALQADPQYAPAYAGLADTYAALEGFYLPPWETMPRAKAAATKALDLDKSLSDAHTSLGTVRLLFDYDWPGAEGEFRRALELNPNSADAHHGLAAYLAAMGRREEALDQIRRAQDLDPLSAAINVELAWLLFISRQYDQAIEQSRKMIDVEPSMALAHTFLALAYERKDRLPEAVAEAEKGAQLDDSPLVRAMLGGVYAAAKKTTETQRVLDQLKAEAKRRYVCPYEVALIHLRLGDTDQAMKWLAKAYQERESCMAWLKVDPRFDPLRSDPRFQALLRRMGFTP